MLYKYSNLKVAFIHQFKPLGVCLGIQDIEQMIAFPTKENGSTMM